MGTKAFILRVLGVTVCALGVAAAGCVGAEPSSGDLYFTESKAAEQPLVSDVVGQAEILDWDEVKISVIEVGPDQYIVTAKTIIDAPVSTIWGTIRDFEKLTEIGLGGVLTDFQWLNGGGPEVVPSSFQFLAGDTLVIQELYYRNKFTHTMRHHILNLPVLGIQEYDAEIDLTPFFINKTMYIATRELTVDAEHLEGLVALIELDTTNIANYFENP